MQSDKVTEIIKMIRKKSMFELWIGVIFLIVGALCLYLPVKSLYRYYSADTDIADVVSDAMSYDTWYQCDNNLLVGSYADDDDGTYYVTTTADHRFMGFYVPKAQADKADRIMEACWNYLNDEADSLPEESISGIGYLKGMTKTEAQYFCEWFEEEGAGDDMESYLNYKTFYLSGPGKALTNQGITVVLGAVGVVTFLVSLIKVLVFVTGGYMKNFKKTLAKSNITYDMLAADMAHAAEFPNQSVGQKYTLFFGSMTALIVHDDLLWVYLSVTTTRHRGGIPYTTKDYQVVCAGRHNTELMAANSEEEAQGIIEEIHKRAPYIFVGYTDELHNLYSHNISAMIAAVEKAREQQDSDPVDDSGE